MLETTPTEVRGALVQPSTAQLQLHPRAAALKAESACIHARKNMVFLFIPEASAQIGFILFSRVIETRKRK